MAYCIQSNIVCVDFAGEARYSTGYTICISNDETVYSFGQNARGALGHEEDYRDRRIVSPSKIPPLKQIRNIDCGNDHTACVDYNGLVFTFGSNRYGQLGMGNELNFTHEPQRVNVPSTKQVNCCEESTFCVSENGELYSFGENEYGQLAIKDASMKQTLPQKVESLIDIDFIRCGGKFFICRTFNNEFYCCGYNDECQFGFDSYENENLPMKATNWPDNIIDIKCGKKHTVLLTENGDIFTSGSDYCKQLGRKINSYFASTFGKIESTLKYIRIECGDYHTMCIDSNNTLHCFGNNSNGQLGVGDTKERGEPTEFPIPNIINISSRGTHSFIKTSSNEIFGFGMNKHGQLGITSSQIQHTPIQVLQNNEELWCSNINKSKVKSARK